MYCIVLRSYTVLKLAKLDYAGDTMKVVRKPLVQVASHLPLRMKTSPAVPGRAPSNQQTIEQRK